MPLTEEEKAKARELQEKYSNPIPATEAPKKDAPKSSAPSSTTRSSKTKTSPTIVAEEQKKKDFNITDIFSPTYTSEKTDEELYTPQRLEPFLEPSEESIAPKNGSEIKDELSKKTEYPIILSRNGKIYFSNYPPKKSTPLSSTDVQKAEEVAYRQYQDIQDVNLRNEIFGRIEEASNTYQTELLTPQGERLPYSPGAVAPRYPYESFTDAPTYEELASFDKAAQELLRRQGAGVLSPLAPQVIDPNFNDAVKLYNSQRGFVRDVLVKSQQDPSSVSSQYVDAFLSNANPDIKRIGEYLTILRDLKNMPPEDKEYIVRDALTVYDNAFDPMRQTLAKSIGGITGSRTAEDIVETATRLGGSLTRQQVTGTGLMESPLETGLRLFNTPFALAGGVVEGIATGVFTDAGLGESISSATGRYLREGRGLPDAVSTITGNLSPTEGLRDEFTMAGYVAGLAAEFIGPQAVFSVSKTGKLGKLIRLIPDKKLAEVTDIAITNPRGLTSLIDETATSIPVTRLTPEDIQNPIESAARKISNQPAVDDLVDVIVSNKPISTLADASKDKLNRAGFFDSVTDIADNITGTVPEKEILDRASDIDLGLPAIYNDLPERLKPLAYDVINGNTSAITPELTQAVKNVVVSKVVERNLIRGIVYGVDKATPVAKTMAGNISRNLVRLTPEVFVSQNKANKILNEARSNPIISGISDRLSKSKGAVDITPNESAFINEYINTNIPGKISTSEFNNLFETVLKVEAFKEPGFVRASKLGAAIERLSERAVDPLLVNAPNIIKRQRDAAKARYLDQTLFTPQVISDGIILRNLKAVSDLATLNVIKNPVVREIVDETASELSSVKEQFVRLLNITKKENPNLSRPDVFVKALADDAGASNLFDDYIRTIYGVSDTVSEVKSAPGMLNGMLPSTTPQKLAQYILNSDAVSKLREDFVQLISSGEYNKALRLLNSLHNSMTFENFTELIWKEQKDLAQRGNANAIKWINQAGSIAPPNMQYVKLNPQEIAKVLALSFTERKNREAVSNALIKAEQKYPEIISLSDTMIEDWKDNLKNRLSLGNSSVPIANFDSFVDSLSESDIRRLMTADAIGNIPSADLIINEKFDEILSAAGLPQADINNLKMNYSTPPALKTKVAQIFNEEQYKRGFVRKPKEAAMIAKESIKRRFAASLIGDRNTALKVLDNLNDPKIRKEIADKFDLNSFEKSINDMLLGGREGSNTLDDVNIYSNVLYGIERALENSGRNLKKNQSVLDYMIELGGKGFDSLQNIIRSGTLAGAIVPNIPYHMQNFISAPLITYQTLGTQGLKAFKSFPEALDIVDAINKNSDKVYRFGDKVYTGNELSDMISKSSLMRSRATADFKNGVYSDLIKTARLNPNATERNRLIGFLSKYLNPARENVYARFANETDLLFRTSQLVDALKAGKSKDEAVKLARAALFDYGSLSDVERRTISRIVWFYSFWSRNIGSTLKNMIQNPQRFALTARLTADANPRDMFSKYEQNPAFAFLSSDIEDEESDNKGYYLSGPDVPIKDALAEILDAASDFAILGSELTGRGAQISATSAAEEAAYNTLFNVLGRSGPTFQLGMGILADKKTDGKNLAVYPNPKLIDYLESVEKISPAAKQKFFNYFHITEEPTDPGSEYATRYGKTFKIEPGYQKRWFAFEQLLQAVGIKRALADYRSTLNDTINLASEFIPMEDSGESAGGYAVESNTLGEAILRGLGVVRPAPARTQQETEEALNKQRLERIREIRR